MSGTMRAVGLLGTGVVLTAGILAVGQVAWMTQRAQQAADLTAISVSELGAKNLLKTDYEPCLLAKEIALANGAQLVACQSEKQIPVGHEDAQVLRFLRQTVTKAQIKVEIERTIPWLGTFRRVAQAKAITELGE
ncbi:hypothetical protein BK816_00645 [Boudabousia tangfeifanii]|uniref:Uncharacterized protein n=1 Tax=Boudabousia tangfeifanii TaxID=1912795 RepID=A0A1D9MI68_9ACTO|nr:flp pilus-assembly TadE/G-like family protein [Boudabousia tangfeifanii]AOZ71984.1 hypothetical protein BK816_00645 [Boudabousia tangfeifanii]